jgi:dolichol-phosphate mannosyltransferase
MGSSHIDAFVSVIVPLRNAVAWVDPALRELHATLRQQFRNFEIVLIDAASDDEMVGVIEQLQRELEGIQLFILGNRVNFDVATVAGLDNCIGDYVFVLNLETDPPSLLEDLWAKSRENHEVVVGVRRDRARGSVRALLSHLYYKVFQRVTGIRIPVGISTPRLFTRRVVSYIVQNNDRSIMVRVLPFFSSYRVSSVEYAARGRSDSFQEQTLTNGFFQGITLLLGSSVRPLRVFTGMALLASAVSLLYSIYVIAVSIFNRNVVEGWISLAFPLSVFSFFMSTVLGIVAEYVYMLFQQSGNRPAYLIAAESTSSVQEIRRKLNVVEASGEFADHDL